MESPTKQNPKRADLSSHPLVSSILSSNPTSPLMFAHWKNLNYADRARYLELSFVVLQLRAAQETHSRICRICQSSISISSQDYRVIALKIARSATAPPPASLVAPIRSGNERPLSASYAAFFAFSREHVPRTRSEIRRQLLSVYFGCRSLCQIRTFRLHQRRAPSLSDNLLEQKL